MGARAGPPEEARQAAGVGQSFGAKIGLVEISRKVSEETEADEEGEAGAEGEGEARPEEEDLGQSPLQRRVRLRKLPGIG